LEGSHDELTSANIRWVVHKSSEALDETSRLLVTVLVESNVVRVVTLEMVAEVVTQARHGHVAFFVIACRQPRGDTYAEANSAR